MTQISTRRRRKKRRAHGARALIVGLSLILVAAAVAFISFFPKGAQKVAYPVRYAEQIRAASEAFGLDAARVAAVAYCESSYRADAVSYAGARGLMQIMPETGAWIAGKLDERESYTDEMLFDAETNLRYGCWYLQYLDARFDGDLTEATAAYHAGPARVGEWLQDAAYSSDGKTLKALPEGATREYVRRVLAAYENYKELYEHEASE